MPLSARQHHRRVLRGLYHTISTVGRGENHGEQEFVPSEHEHHVASLSRAPLPRVQVVPPLDEPHTIPEPARVGVDHCSELGEHVLPTGQIAEHVGEVGVDVACHPREDSRHALLRPAEMLLRVEECGGAVHPMRSRELVGLNT